MAYAQFDNTSFDQLSFAITNVKTGGVIYSGTASGVDMARAFDSTKLTLNNVKGGMAEVKVKSKTLSDYHDEFGEIWESAFRTAMRVLKDMEAK